MINIIFVVLIITNIFFIDFHCIINFSQQWILDKQDLIRERQQDLVVLNDEEYQKIFIFFANCKCYSN